MHSCFTDVTAADTELFLHVIGSRKHSDGTKLLFDFLQQPRLNKQVTQINRLCGCNYRNVLTIDSYRNY